MKLKPVAMLINHVFPKVWSGAAVTAIVHGTHFAGRFKMKRGFSFDFWFVSVVRNNNSVIKV